MRTVLVTWIAGPLSAAVGLWGATLLAASPETSAPPAPNYPPPSARSAQDAKSAETAAARLVQAGLASRLAGDGRRCEELLRQAREQSPDDPAAHWHSGEVAEGGQWQRPEDVQRKARQDARQAEFQRLRAGVTDLAGCAALARWCRKNRLPDEERVAWLAVLGGDPGNAEAAKALRLVPYQGAWLPQGEINRRKAQARAVAKARDSWKPLIVKWRTATERADALAIEEILGKIRQISQSSEMTAVEQVLWREVGTRHEHQKSYRAMVTALIAALEQSPQQPATEALVRWALFARAAETRRAAVAALKTRPKEGFVPLLVSSMVAPLELSIQMEPGVGGYVMTRFSIFREGPLANERYSWGSASILTGETLVVRDWASAAAFQQAAAELRYPATPILPKGLVVNLGMYDTDAEAEAAVAAAAARMPRVVAYMNRENAVVADFYRRYMDVAEAKGAAAAAPGAVSAAGMTARMAGHNAQAGPAAATTAVAAQQQAAALRAEVAEINLQIAERNKAIAAVLAETTGKDCGEDPIAWWNWWWREYNEMAFATTSGARSSGDVPGGDASVDTPKPEYRQDNYQYRSVGVRAPTTWVPSGPASAPPYVQGGGSGFFAGSLYSCFLRGTPVWTLRGVAPIEEIKPGDRVLAQDADSGELAYKPVLGVTVRPPCAGVTIRCGAERLTATPGHAFWVEGRGWRMAKQLAAGDRLHTPRGSLTVTGVQRVPAPEARDATMHNLVVADAGTYFVGQDPVLVHDITPHGLTTCALPGMRPGTAVAAVESAAAADAK